MQQRIANKKLTLDFYNKWQYLETRHPFHIVDPSPWPILTSMGVFPLAIGGVGYLHGYAWGSTLLIASLLYLLVIIGH